jgi:hypothetical protein
MRVRTKGTAAHRIPNQSDDGSGTAERPTVEPVDSDAVAVDAVVVVDGVPVETVAADGAAGGIVTAN